MALDSKSKKEMLVILVLTPVFGFLLWNNLISPQMKRHRAVQEAKQRAAEFSLQSTEIQHKTLSRNEDIAKFTTMDWGRNPFLQPGLDKIRPPTGDKTASTVAPKFNLEGIVWDKDFPYAIINGEVWQTGDEVGGYRVQSIDKESVTLESGGKTIELKLFTDLW